MASVKVKNLGCTGTINGVQWPDFGGVIELDVPKHVLDDLIDGGFVEKASSSDVKEAEKAEKEAEKVAKAEKEAAQAANVVETATAPTANVETRKPSK